MSKHTAKYIPLNQVINEYISEANLTPAAYIRLYHLAIRAMEEMHMDVSGEPRTRVLNVSPNKTVALPGDYLEYIKIGVINSNGEVVTLTENKNLTLYRKENSEQPLDPNDLEAGVEEW